MEPEPGLVRQRGMAAGLLDVACAPRRVGGSPAGPAPGRPAAGATADGALAAPSRSQRRRSEGPPGRSASPVASGAGQLGLDVVPASAVDGRALTVDTGGMAGAEDLDQLVRRYHRRLVGLAYALCGSRSDAEDIVADAYARAWPRLARGKVDDPAAYLRRAVVNGSVSWRRHHFLVRREELRRRVAPEPPASDELAGSRSELWSALQSLPLGQRQVIALRFIEDLSEAETADVLGIPAGTVKSRTARALATLRSVLPEEQDV